MRAVPGLGQVHRPAWIDPACELVSKTIRQQIVDRHVGLIHVGHMGITRRIGEPCRLHLKMHPIRSARVQPVQFQPRQDVECDQRGDALAIGWYLKQPVPSEIRPDGRHIIS